MFGATDHWAKALWEKRVREAESDGDLRACLRICIVHSLRSALGRSLNGRFVEFMCEDASSSRYCVRLRGADPKFAWKRLKQANLGSVDHKKFETFPVVSLPWGSAWLPRPELYDMLLKLERLVRDHTRMAEPGTLWEDVLRTIETVILHFNDSTAKLQSLCLRIDAISRFICRLGTRMSEHSDYMDAIWAPFFEEPLMKVQKAILELQTCFHMEFIFQHGLCRLAAQCEKAVEDPPVVQNVWHPPEPVAVRDPVLLNEQAEHDWAENVERVIASSNAPDLVMAAPASEDVLLMHYTRSSREFEDTLFNGPDLAGIQQRMNDHGYNYRLESGAKIFVWPQQYEEVVEFVNGKNTVLYTSHVIISRSLIANLEAAIARIPSRKNVKQKAKRTMLAAQSSIQVELSPGASSSGLTSALASKKAQISASAMRSIDEFEWPEDFQVKRTFLCTVRARREPSSVVQSTTELHGGHNPRRVVAQSLSNSGTSMISEAFSQQ